MITDKRRPPSLALLSHPTAIADTTAVDLAEKLPQGIHIVGCTGQLGDGGRQGG